MFLELMIGEKIVRIEDDIDIHLPGIKIIEGSRLIAVPGFMDQHVHILGGGGEGGYGSRISEISAEKCLQAGITTVIGLLGTDCIGKSIGQLVLSSRTLSEQGLTAYCLSGGYASPPLTLTGSVEKDIVFIPEIIGVKIAIADSRASPLTYQELTRLAAEVRRAGMLSSKAGIMTIHIGEGKQGFSLIMEAIKNSNIPITQFRPTHVGHHLAEAIDFAKNGGYIDFTANEDVIRTADDIKLALQSGTPVDRITISSDAQGSIPSWDSLGNLIGYTIASVKALGEVVKLLITKHSLDFEKVISFVTKNVATALNLETSCIRRSKPDSCAEESGQRAQWSASQILLSKLRQLKIIKVHYHKLKPALHGPSMQFFQSILYFSCFQFLKPSEWVFHPSNRSEVVDLLIIYRCIQYLGVCYIEQRFKFIPIGENRQVEYQKAGSFGISSAVAKEHKVCFIGRYIHNSKNFASVKRDSGEIVLLRLELINY